MSIILLITIILIGKVIDTYIKQKRINKIDNIISNGQLYIYNVISRINYIQTMEEPSIRVGELGTINEQYHTIKQYFDSQPFGTGCQAKDFYLNQLRKEILKLESIRQNKGKSWTVKEICSFTTPIQIPEIAL